MKFLEYAKHVNASETVLDWVKKRMAEEIETTEGEHVIDYLISDKAPKRLERATYEQMKKKTDEWVKTMNKKGEHIKESKEDTEVVLDFGDGFKIVRLIGKNAYEREGYLMRHCVAGYYGRNVEIYSLRDKDNMPHCTMEKDQQVKGKGNGDIHPKYVGYVVKFLEHVGMTVGDSEMRHLGYMNLEKLKGDLHPETPFFNGKYVPKNIKLKDIEGNDYASLDLLDNVPLIEEDSEKNLKINFELKTFIKLSIDFLFRKVKSSKVKTGRGEVNSSTGHYTRNASSGDSTQNASSGHSTQNASSGDYTRNASSGDSTRNASSGHYTQNASSGHSTRNASSGHSTQNASSGDYTRNASSGDSTQNASSGHYTQNASSGHYTRNASSGDSTQNELNGKHSVSVDAGHGGQIKGKIGNWFALTEWCRDEKDDKWRPLCVKATQIDGKIIKEDVWYTLKNGEFVEVE